MVTQDLQRSSVKQTWRTQPQQSQTCTICPAENYNENISPLHTTYYSLHDPRGFLYNLFPTMWIPIINASQKRRNKQGGKNSLRAEKRRKAESKNAYGSCRHFWWMVARKRLDELLVMLDYRSLSGKRVSAPPLKRIPNESCKKE